MPSLRRLLIRPRHLRWGSGAWRSGWLSLVDLRAGAEVSRQALNCRCLSMEEEMPKEIREKSIRTARKSTMDERDRREDRGPKHDRNTRARERYNKEEERERERDRRGESASKYGPSYVTVGGRTKKVFMVRDTKARPNFSTAFRSDFWKPSADHGHICGICKTVIQSATPQDKKNRGIDHIVDWHSYILMNADPVECCYGGFHWEVWIEKEVNEAYCDIRNLQPSHRTCNSSKSGPKSFDAFKSIKLNPLVRCDGGCKKPKGSD